MKKLRLYLDTSVISHLFAEDTPDTMSDTLEFWEEIKTNKYDIILSDLTLEEIDECKEPKRTKMFEILAEIKYSLAYKNNNEVLFLANEIIDKGILTSKSFDDAQHIGIAIHEQCNIIVSWNFKHLVRLKTIHGVRTITVSNNYQNIDIFSPQVILDKEI